MNKLKIGILGYGNIGRGVELAVNRSEDMETVGVFTRRASIETVSGVKSYSVNELYKFENEIDVLVLCGGSATDLPQQGPQMLEKFNTVDSFGTHAKIPEYFAKMDETGKRSGKLGIISVGWDPGLFSVARMMFEAILPCGKDYTFWGKGVSQGHSDALRRLDGVANAIQYTLPKEDALRRVRSGENPSLSTRDKHLRECFVVAKDGADRKEIERQIVTMPNYFADYDTNVYFIDAETMAKEHCTMPHGGSVIRSGETSEGTRHVAELSIGLDSNPQFTASILIAYARAVRKMAKEGRTGAITVYDVPPAYLSPQSSEDLRKKLL